MRPSLATQTRIEEWYLRRFLGRLPRALLRTVTLPVGRHLKTDQNFRHENARMLHTAMSLISHEGVEGDYLEFGVYQGRSFVEAAHAADYWKRRTMRFLAFDSFAGLPEIGVVDINGPFSKSDYRASRSRFEATLRNHRVSPDRVTIVEGFYEDTLKQVTRTSIPVERAAVAFVDCDLYSSTVCVLKFLTDLLQDGSVLIFDDWHTFNSRPDRGEQRATSEWLERNPQLRLVPYRSFSWCGQSFIVNRDD